VDDVFVVGMGRSDREQLERALGDRYRFHPLLRFDDVRYRDEVDFDGLLARATDELDAAAAVDGVIGYWDFPTSSLVPLLQHRFGLPGPPLEAVGRCEHQYWSRLVQRRARPDLVPRSVAFDPYGEPPRELPMPCWVKPVKSFTSQLAMAVDDHDDLAESLVHIRREIPRFGRPFERFLAHLDVPSEVAGVRGTWCVAEEPLSGAQCTLEGYVHRGEVHAYGVVDSHREGRSTFSRFQYPSRLDEVTVKELAVATREVIGAIGLDEAAFNVEFFVDEERGDIGLLEINPRISQSHAPLFAMVDGTPNYEVAAALAVGRRPQMKRGAGGHRVAAKVFVRSWEEGTVTSAPSAEDVRGIEVDHGAHVTIVADTGTRLAELREQETYSYVLAVFYVGGADEAELDERIAEVRSRLRFTVSSG
jgi:hypothetical protein